MPFLGLNDNEQTINIDLGSAEGLTINPRTGWSFYTEGWWLWPELGRYPLIPLITFKTNAEIIIEFTVVEGGEYSLFVNYFANPNGGNINIWIDDRSFQIPSKAVEGHYCWSELGPIYLKPGRHFAKITNTMGQNALNSLIFAKPSNLDGWQNKKVLYLVMEDLNQREYAGADISSCSLKIIKDCMYRIWLKGNGNFVLIIEGGDGVRRFDLEGNGQSLIHTESFFLAQGTYTVKLFGEGSGIMYYLIAPSELVANQITEIIGEPNASRNLSYERVNATYYRVNVSATGPFLLSFTEAYDPGWVAEIKGPSGNIKRYQAIPLYPMRNGFLIDVPAGNYEVIVRYNPQRMVFVGFIVSIIVYAACGFYIVWTWYKLHNSSFRLGREEEQVL